MANIEYKTDAIANYFATNRVRWGQFYESERKVIEALEPNAIKNVLDIGCGCGGLGLALRERFGVTRYQGVEINAEAVSVGNSLNHGAVIHGDILEVRNTQLAAQKFDLVFSLSCVDWNVEFAAMLSTAWELVQPGGNCVATFRLTNGAGCSDMAHCYQHINYEGERQGELAAYVVLNAGELMRELLRFDPARIHIYGYWGEPSASAVTPYDRLCFVACAFSKRALSDVASKLKVELDLPSEIKAQMEHVLSTSCA
jgi:SAM-dependent methyltransferase